MSTILRICLALLICLVVSTFTAIAFAQVKVKKTSTTTTTVVKESESDTDDTPAPTTVVTESEPKESVKTATFGSKAMSGMAGCKTEELSKGVVKDLKADCSAWVKDQKSELKSKFLTSACEEHCDDCGMSLRRCTVTGSIHYTLR